MIVWLRSWALRFGEPAKGALARKLGSASQQLKKMLRTYISCRQLRLERLVGVERAGVRLTVDLATEAKLEPRDYAQFKPGSAAALSAGALCMEKAVMTFAHTWRGMANSDPERVPLLAAKGNMDAMVALACAEADATTRQRAELLRKIAHELSPMPTP